MLLIEKLAEQQITSARDRGELNNLPGEGKPLTLDDDSAVPSDKRAAYRVLKNSGYIPPEIDQLKEVRSIESLLAQVDSDAEKKRLLLKLALLRAKLPALAQTMSSTTDQCYQDKIVECLAK